MTRRRRFWVLGVLWAVAILATLVTQHPTTRALMRYARDSDEMVVPVEGVQPKSLSSSWGAPRSGHRRHQGIDIFARRGTPVVAAAEGQVVRIGDDRLGGRVVWVAGAGARLYYYAHLDHFRAGLAVGERVESGDTLGYVGNTGNARTTPAHLHFGVYPFAKAFRAVDPAPLLKTRARVHFGRRG